MDRVIYCDTREQARTVLKSLRTATKKMWLLVKDGEKEIRKVGGIIDNPEGIPGSEEYTGHPCRWGVEIEV